MLRKRLATPLRIARQKAILEIKHESQKERDRCFYFGGFMSAFIFVGAAAVIFEILSASPKAAADAYSTIEEFADPKYAEGAPLSIEQRAIVARYSATYSKDQLLGLDQDERFVASQIAKYKRDQRWLHVQSVLQHFAYVYAPKLSQKQIAQHFFVLWGRLENEVVKIRPAANAPPTPE